MDFSGIVEDTANGVYNIIVDVLRMDISPDTKINQIQAVLSQVGAQFGQKMFDDVSRLFGSSAIKSSIPYSENDQVYTLAQKIVRDSAFALDDKPLVKEYGDVILGRAQHSAFENARSLDRHPTLTRRMRGETCQWCVDRAGTFTDPPAELFARHDNCDCLFIVSGYNSRNGVLKNYKKEA